MEANKGLKDEREMQEFHKKTIIEMIEKTNHTGALEYLHRFIELYLEKWG